MIRKKTIILLSLLWMGQVFVTAQESKPVILDFPEDWRYEKLDVPLDFAPDLPYKGFEEVRFAPGMFNTSAADYFSYLFVLSINNKTQLSKEEVETFLNAYYKGLCENVASSKNIEVDIAEVTTSITAADETFPEAKNYTAEVTFFDVFTNGQKIKLNIELETLPNYGTKGMYILAAVSPKQKDAPIWKKLLETKEKVRNFKIYKIQ